MRFESGRLDNDRSHLTHCYRWQLRRFDYSSLKPRLTGKMPADVAMERPDTWVVTDDADDGVVKTRNDDL